MKKFSFLIAFLLISSVGFAQITFGPKAGIGIAKVNDIHGGSTQRVAPYFGVFATIPMNDYGQQFFIQPELLYSMVGEKDNEDPAHLDYLYVPVLFKAYFSENDTEFFGELGPQVGFLVNKNVPQPDLDWSAFDYGATVGIGFSYLRMIEANIRFYLGFADIVSDDPGEYNNFNSNLNFGLAYRF